MLSNAQSCVVDLSSSRFGIYICTRIYRTTMRAGFHLHYKRKMSMVKCRVVDTMRTIPFPERLMMRPNATTVTFD